MNKKVKILIAASLLNSLFLTGCWDKVEIDRKAYFTSIGLDIAEDADNLEQLKEIKVGEPFQGKDVKTISVSFAYPDMDKIIPGKGNTRVKDNVVTAKGYSIQDVLYKANTSNARDFRFGQSRVLLISNEYLKHPELLKQALDYFERQPLINRMMYVVSVEGKAEEYLNGDFKFEKNIYSFVEGIMENTRRNSSIHPANLNDLLVSLNNTHNAVIPRFIYDEESKETKISGLTILKNYKEVGSFTPVETSLFEILKGNVKGCKKAIFKDGVPIDIEIEDANRKIVFEGMDNGKLKFGINVELDAQLKAYYTEKSLNNESLINEIEKEFNDSIKVECEKVVKKSQQSLKVDVIGLQEYLEKFKPKVWNEVKDNWDEYFKNADVRINIDTKIKRIGVID